MYRVGFRPWDTDRVPAELSGLVEGPEARPGGRALDIGCGTGMQAAYLARLGWRVTAVDALMRSLKRARAAFAAAVSELAAPGATLLMMAFAPNRIPAAPAGIEESEIRGRFAGWQLISARPDTEDEISGPLRNVPRTWYRPVRG